MTNPTDFNLWSHDICNSVASFLDQHLPSAQLPPQRLHEAMRYATLEGGKRVRPLLCFAAGELSQAPASSLTVVACSVELIHAYSLVHDDLPAMDNDVLRRGKPTCHIQFGEAVAILTGDVLQTQAFEWLSDPSFFPNQPERQLELVHQLSYASGAQGMAGGQALDLESTQQPVSLAQIKSMHFKKTGALIRASLLMGAACGDPLPVEQQRALCDFAEALGLAFQVVDDCLDAEMDTATLGKTAGKDAAANKATTVGIMGLSKAKGFAQELHAAARQALALLGPRSARLEDLTDFIINRRS